MVGIILIVDWPVAYTIMCSLQTQVEIVLGNNFFLLMPVLLCKITLRYESTAEPRGARGAKDTGKA